MFNTIYSFIIHFEMGQKFFWESVLILFLLVSKQKKLYIIKWNAKHMQNNLSYIAAALFPIEK